MKNIHPRMLRESATITAMMNIYCTEVHGSAGELCPDCRALDAYAQMRLERCPFQEKKSTCAKCTVHCYKPEQREHIRRVMRYAGPRMLAKHPVLAVRHLLDGLRRPPVLRRKESSTD
jgi:predicted amidophosphoribosyltransferase